MKNLLAFLLTLTFCLSSIAREYPVARIKGVITKIKGDRVRVQGQNKQIFWVRRNEVYPRGSQILDEVTIYKKVRFQEFITPAKTSFFIKYKRTQMINAIRTFFVQYEKTTPQNFPKRKYSFWEKAQSFFTTPRAHASPTDGKCYAGGQVFDAEDGICEIPDKLQCNDKNDKNKKGFKCNTALFYTSNTKRREKSKVLKNITYENSDDFNGFCVKTETQMDFEKITRRCYMSALMTYGHKLQDSPNETSQIFNHFIKNQNGDEENIKEELETLTDEITTICNNKNGENTSLEKEGSACHNFISNYKDIEQSILDINSHEKEKEQEKVDKALTKQAKEYQKILTQYENHIIKQQKQIDTLINKAQKVIVTPAYQAEQQQQPIRYIVYQPAPRSNPQVTGHSQAQTYMIAAAAQPQKTVYVIRPSKEVYKAWQDNRNKLKEHDGELASLKEEVEKLKEKSKQSEERVEVLEEKIKESQEENTREENKEQTPLNPAPEIVFKNFVYAQNKDQCGKEKFNADLCFITDEEGEIVRALNKGEDGEYQELPEPILNEKGELVIGEQSYHLSRDKDLDPSLNWECEIQEQEQEQKQKICADLPVACLMKNPQGDILFRRLGYLPSDLLLEKPASKTFTYHFDGKTKKVTTENLTLSENNITEDIATRIPPLRQEACSSKSEYLVKSNIHTCRVPESFTITCQDCDDDKTEVTCNTTLECDVVFKDSLYKKSENKVMTLENRSCPCSKNKKGRYSITDIDQCVFDPKKASDVINAVNKAEKASQQ